MKNKFLICLIALVMASSLFVGLGATSTNAVNLYANNYFTSVSGDVRIDSSVITDKGAKFSFYSGYTSSEARYTKLMHSEVLEVVFNLETVHFTDLYVKFSENYNATKNITITVTVDGDNLKVELLDNLGNKATTTIPAGKLTGEMKFSYSASTKKFKVNGTELVDTGIMTTSFYNNEANMSFGIKGQSTKVDETSVMYINSIENKAGVQSFKADVAKVAPILASFYGVSDIVPVDGLINLKTAVGQRFTFPYYGISVLGDNLTSQQQKIAKTGTEVYDDTWDAKKFAKSTSTTSISMTGKVVVGDVYYIRLSNGLATDKEEFVILKVEVVEDKIAPTLNDAEIAKAVDTAFPDATIVAPKLNNTISFPNLRSGDVMVDFGDEVDTLWNVKFQIGYKRPGSTSWTWASNTDVTINTVGYWTFTYKCTDATGKNISYFGGSVGAKTFGYEVVDNLAPEITATKRVTVTVNKDYTVPSATISDNASGVDDTFTKSTVYFYADKDAKPVLVELKDGILKADKLTGGNATTGYTNYYVVKYEARDNAGNISEVVESILIISEPENEPETNPANEVFKVILIVIACLSGAGIILLLVVNPAPKKKEEKAVVKSNKTDNDKK